MKRNVLIIGMFIAAGLFISTGLQAQTGEGKEQVPKYGEDSVKTITKLSLYQEFYNQ